MNFPLCFQRWAGTVSRMTKRQKAAFLRELTELSRKHGITVGWDYDGLELYDFTESDDGGRYIQEPHGVIWTERGRFPVIVRRKKEELAAKRFKRSPEYKLQKEREDDRVAMVEAMLDGEGARPFQVCRPGHEKARPIAEAGR